MAQLWETWEHPLKPLELVEVPHLIVRMRRRPESSTASPFARSYVNVGRSWRIRGHTEEEVNWVERYRSPAGQRRSVLLLEAKAKRRRDMLAAGILWSARRFQLVPSLQWSAARLVRDQINWAFQQDALRGLPKRTVPQVIKRYLSRAFESKH